MRTTYFHYFTLLPYLLYSYYNTLLPYITYIHYISLYTTYTLLYMRINNFFDLFLTLFL